MKILLITLTYLFFLFTLNLSMLKEESWQERQYQLLDENLVHNTHIYSLLKSHGLKETALLKLSGKNWLPLSFSVQKSQSYNLKNSEEKLNINLIKEGKTKLLLAILMRLYSPYLKSKEEKRLFEWDLLTYLNTQKSSETSFSKTFIKITEPQGISYSLPPLKYFITQKPYTGKYRLCFYQAPYQLASAIFDENFSSVITALENHLEKHFQEKGPKFSYDMHRELKALNLEPGLLEILSTNKNAHKASCDITYLIEDKKKNIYAIFLDYHETP